MIEVCGGKVNGDKRKVGGEMSQEKLNGKKKRI